MCVCGGGGGGGGGAGEGDGFLFSHLLRRHLQTCRLWLLCLADLKYDGWAVFSCAK